MTSRFFGKETPSSSLVRKIISYVPVWERSGFQAKLYSTGLLSLDSRSKDDPCGFPNVSMLTSWHGSIRSSALIKTFDCSSAAKHWGKPSSLHGEGETNIGRLFSLQSHPLAQSLSYWQCLPQSEHPVPSPVHIIVCSLMRRVKSTPISEYPSEIITLVNHNSSLPEILGVSHVITPLSELILSPGG